MNPWMHGGNWSAGAQAGLFATETAFAGKANTKETQDAMREHLRLGFDMRQAGKPVKEEDHEQISSGR